MVAEAIWLSLLLSQQADFARETHRCHISVSDELGAVINNSEIWIHRDAVNGSYPFNKTLSVDQNGQLNVDLAGGFYDVCVVSSAFTPRCRKLRLRDRDRALKFRLSASPEVLKETADSFF